MLELFAFIFVARHTAKRARRLGHTSLWSGLALAGWLLGELLGFLIGAAFGLGLASYLLALLGAAIGATVGYLFVAQLSDLSNELMLDELEKTFR